MAGFFNHRKFEHTRALLWDIKRSILSRFQKEGQSSDRTSISKELIIAVLGLIILLSVLILSLTSSSGSKDTRPAIGPLTASDLLGNTWTLENVKGQTIETFKEGKKPGAPLLVKTDIRQEGQELSIGLVIEGQAGERYVGGAIVNEQWQPAPKLKIVDKQGNVLASGQFKYG